MAYVPDTTALVGNASLVRINRVTDSALTAVLAKMEAFEPATSIKDRVALSTVRAAKVPGNLESSGTVVEATLGNTGVGLAMVGVALEYKVITIMPKTMSKRHRTIMRTFGAGLMLTTEGGVAGAVKRAEEIQATIPNSILVSQFTNPANPKAHREATARGIPGQTEGDTDVFVAGIGTGGMLTGVGQVLCQEESGVKTYGVEPSGSSLLSEGQAVPHKIQGLDPNVVPEVLDRDIWDELLRIESNAVITYAHRTAAEEGLLVGISLGATLAATSELARHSELEGKAVVTILPDVGKRYLSTPLFKDFLD